jgi:hypothetical protein
MDPAQLLIAHAVKVALLLTLLGIAWRGRAERCWSLVAYLFVVLVGNSLVTFWPDVYFNLPFWTRWQGWLAVLKLLVAAELAARIFAGFPGALGRWRLGASLVAGLTTVALILAPWHPHELQPRLGAGTIWLLLVTVLVVAYHRLPLEGWHGAVLLGLAPYLLVFSTVLSIIRAHGLLGASTGLLGLADGAAYLFMLSWWGVAAWRQDGAEVRQIDALHARLAVR